MMLKNNLKIKFRFYKLNGLCCKLLSNFIGLCSLAGLSVLMWWLFSICSSDNSFEIHFNQTILITADVLITGGTITIIAFNGRGARNSGSSTIIRTSFWKNRLLFSKSNLKIFLWNFTLSYIRPTTIILLTVGTSSTEVFLSLFGQINIEIKIYIQAIMFIFTIIFMVSTVSRLSIFYSGVSTTMGGVYLYQLLGRKHTLVENQLADLRNTKNFQMIKVTIDLLGDEHQKLSEDDIKLLDHIFEESESQPGRKSRFLLFNIRNSIDDHAKVNYIVKTLFEKGTKKDPIVSWALFSKEVIADPVEATKTELNLMPDIFHDMSIVWRFKAFYAKTEGCDVNILYENKSRANLEIIKKNSKKYVLLINPKDISKEKDVFYIFDSFVKANNFKKKHPKTKHLFYLLKNKSVKEI